MDGEYYTFLLAQKLKKITLDFLIYCWLIIGFLYIVFNEIYFFQLLNNYLILSWSSYFIAGILFYQIYSDKLKLKYTLTLGLCLITSVYHGIDRLEILNKMYDTIFNPYIITSTIIFFYLLMFTVSIGKLKIINSPKLIKIGKLTYPLYLFHASVGFIMFSLLNNYLNKYAILLIIVSFMILISYLISEFYESKMGAVLNKILKKLAHKFNPLK